MVVARAACKLGTGVELPVSDLLGAFQSELGGELVDHFITLDNLKGAVLNGHEVAHPDDRLQFMVGKAYELLSEFMDEQMEKDTGSEMVKHQECMDLCDDGKGGRIWVGKKNTPLWNEQIAKEVRTENLPEGATVPSASPGDQLVPEGGCCMLS